VQQENLTGSKMAELEVRLARVESASTFATSESMNQEADKHSLTALNADDLTWAKPYVDRARDSVARGNVTPGAEFPRTP
jgi:hypothetical protein